MQRHIQKIRNVLSPANLPDILQTLLRDEAIGGKLIMLAALLAIVVANSSWSEAYQNLWHTELTLDVGDYMLSHDLRHWINDGLMAIFFLVIGLEIKREIVHGELRRFKSALLPVVAAVGGMIVPALIFLWINTGQAGSGGWGIPMATDIAFALGALSLLGSQVQVSLKLFLLTLAISDDIGAIFVIAVFYAGGVSLMALGLSAVIVLIIWLLAKSKKIHVVGFTLLGISLWLTMQATGIHPSITGAILGLLAPLAPFGSHRYSIARHLERAAIPVTTFVVLPLFAFANAGVKLSLDVLPDTAAVSVAWGVFAGLVLGKVIGILSFSWILIKFKLAKKPAGVTWRQLTGIGLLAGIGFTVSILFTEIAFEDSQHLIEASKFGIIAGSTVSAALGVLLLQRIRQPD